MPLRLLPSKQDSIIFSSIYFFLSLSSNLQRILARAVERKKQIYVSKPAMVIRYEFSINIVIDIAHHQG